MHRQTSSLHGVIVVDKPGGITSAAVVSAVKRALGVKKIGHTGTLDPMATGVLPLCIGEGTKIASYLLAADKAYEGELVLGIETDTLDREGQVVAENRGRAEQVNKEEVLAAMATLTGPIQQMPPMFSAIRQSGRRLHELARAGEVVERAPRSVVVREFQLLSFSEGRARFSALVSKGTYVRSLVHDLGQALGCGAHLSELRRTKAGQFGLEGALSLREIEEGKALLQFVDPAAALHHMPRVRVPVEWASAVADGKRLPWQYFGDSEPDSQPILLLTPDGISLLAIVVIEEERLRYRRVFNYALTGETRSSNLPAETV